MQGLGVLLLSIAAWLMYCGSTGVAPLKTAAAILASPGKAEDVIAKARQDVVSLDASTNTSLTGSTVIGTGDAAKVIAYARAQIGKPYIFGGTGPNGYDCSGLSMMAYREVGVSLTHSALAQLSRGVPITNKADLQVGDLLFPTGVGTALGDHVQIYSGNGNIVEAARPGTNVRERDMWGFSGDKVTARRLVKNPKGSGGGGTF